MRSAWNLWQDPDFLAVYADAHGWVVDEINGTYLLISNKRFWEKRSTVNADEVKNHQEVWEKYPNTLIKTYTPIDGLKSKTQDVGTYLLDLTGDYKSKFSKNRRYYIRKALESRQRVDVSNDEEQLRDFYYLYQRRGAEKQFKVHRFKEARRILNSPYGILITSRLKGDLTGGLFLLVGEKESLAWIGATDTKLNIQTNLLLFNYAYEYLEDKVETFDLGGTILETGIDQFKREYGGTYRELCLYRRQPR